MAGITQTKCPYFFQYFDLLCILDVASANNEALSVGDYAVNMGTEESLTEAQFPPLRRCTEVRTPLGPH